jgi:hypothetical protein
MACNSCHGGGGGVYSPFPASGANDLVVRVSWDEKAEMCRLCIEQKFPFCVIVKTLCLVECFVTGCFCLVFLLIPKLKYIKV